MEICRWEITNEEALNNHEDGRNKLVCLAKKNSTFAPFARALLFLPVQCPIHDVE